MMGMTRPAAQDKCASDDHETASLKQVSQTEKPTGIKKQSEQTHMHD